MARKKDLSLDKYISRMLAREDIKKVKGVIGNLKAVDDFLICATVLHSRDKDAPTTVILYESFFRSFNLRSHSICHCITKDEWHMWTEILIEMSSVLWKWRDKFNQKLWLDTNSRIYELSFGRFMSSHGKNHENGLCNMCLRLISQILLNFSSYARGSDKSEDFHLSSNKVKEVWETIGIREDFVTHANFIEEKIDEHSSLSLKSRPTAP